MTTVTEKNAVPDTTINWTAFASDLQIPPGHVPQSLSTTLGNKLPFNLVRVLRDGSMVYFQQFGCIYLNVYAD